jgi:YMGG-like Gly-zipper
MNKLRASFLALSAAILLAGCAEEPVGPTIPVMPAKGKSFAEFQQDQAACEQYAHQSVAGQVDQANNHQVANTLIGTALGAGLGAAVGNTKGAIIGGAAGAALGASAGPGPYAGYGIQRRYNIAYAQCMTSHGNQVAMRPRRYGPPPGYYPPPPPPGYGPPPPPPPGSY